MRPRKLGLGWSGKQLLGRCRTAIASGSTGETPSGCRSPNPQNYCNRTDQAAGYRSRGLGVSSSS